MATFFPTSEDRQRARDIVEQLDWPGTCARSDRQADLVAQLFSALDVAEAKAPSACMASSAELCVKDARRHLRDLKVVLAAARVRDSLKYSVGVFGVVFQDADALLKQIAEAV